MTLRPHPSLSELSAQLDEEPLEPTLLRSPPPPEQPPLTDFEVEMRQRLAELASHLARTDAVVLGVQRDVRQQIREAEKRLTAKVSGLGVMISKLVEQVSKLVVNGHG